MCGGGGGGVGVGVGVHVRVCVSSSLYQDFALKLLTCDSIVWVFKCHKGSCGWE